jgi:hypothetical protein
MNQLHRQRAYVIAMFGLLAWVAGCVPHAKQGQAAAPEKKLDNSRERALNLEPLPQSTVAGPDTDHDHIRDDVAAFIDQTWGGNERKRLSARQFARSVQHGLVYANDKERAMEAGDEDSRAIECLYAYYDSKDADAIWREVRARTIDTEERLQAYYKEQNQLGGGYFASAREPNQSCAFDQQGLTP